MIDELIKVVAIIIVSAIFITAIRTKVAEQSLILAITVITIASLAVFSNLFGAVVKLRDLFNKSGNSSVYFTTALKALGVSYISTFAADICRDYGLSALAQVSETTGKITIFLLSLPLMTAVLEAALKFVDL